MYSDYIDAVKHLCRIDTDSEDAYLLDDIEASVNHISQIIQRNIYAKITDITTDDKNGIVFDKSIAKAALILVRFWQDAEDTREACTYVPGLPDTVYRLIQPYRIYGV